MKEKVAREVGRRSERRASNVKEGVLVSEGVARDGVTSGTRRRSMRGEQLKIQEAEKRSNVHLFPGTRR